MFKHTVVPDPFNLQPSAEDGEVGDVDVKEAPGGDAYRTSAKFPDFGPPLPLCPHLVLINRNHKELTHLLWLQPWLPDGYSQIF